MPVPLRLPIVGPRITIRAPVEADLEEWYLLEADPEVKRYVRGPVTRPREEWVTGMRGVLEAGTPHLAVEDRASGLFAGRAALSMVDWELQVLIARAHWGEGLGREVSELLIGAAFGYMRAPCVTAVIDPGNAASLRLVEALGFARIGTKDRDEDAWNYSHLIYGLDRPKRRPAASRRGQASNAASGSSEASGRSQSEA
jgi:ribosomal-protein-alanine N-acetyltransferase